MDRCAEVEFAHLAGRDPDITRVLRGDTVAGRQRAFVELHDEIRTTVFIRNRRARDVETTFSVRRHQDAVGRGKANIGNAELTGILVAIDVLVVEDFADDVRAVEYRVGYYTSTRVQPNQSHSY